MPCGSEEAVEPPERVTRMASTEVSAPTRSARLGGLTPGPRPGAHRDQPPHLTVVHGRTSCPSTPGHRPGVNSPGPACAGNPCDSEEAVQPPERVTRMASAKVSAPTRSARLAGFNPAPTARGSPRPTPPPAGRARPDELSVDPGAHPPQPPHRRAARRTPGAAPEPGAPARRAAVRQQTLIAPNPGAWPGGWPTRTAHAVDNRAAVEEAMQGPPRHD